MSIVTLVKAAAMLAAAAILGHWFLTEVKRARVQGAPWYKPYVSPPGLLIMVALLLPVLLWLARS